MNYTLEELIHEAGKLPPIPQVAQKALALVRDTETNMGELAHVIGSDQVLAARMLRWANSAHYGMGNQIATVQQALVILGMNTVQELILIHSLSNHFNRPLPGYDLQRGELWRHALSTAIGAKLISKQQHLNIDEEAYFAGLLCDIGKLIFEKLLLESNINQLRDEQVSFLDMERANFGIDHALLGAEIARSWNLPENLVNAIAYHHEPQSAPAHSLLAAVVHLANVTTMLLGVGIGIDGLRYTLDVDVLKSLHMTEEDLPHLISNVSDQLIETLDLFSLG